MSSMIPRATLFALALLLAACGGPAEPEAPAPRPEEVEEEREPVEREDPEEREEPEPEPKPEPKPKPDPEPIELPEPEPEPEEAVESPVPLLPGALLPMQRIIAFYGNPNSTRMGILGELPPDEMLSRLDREVAAWRAADPATPVKPALHLIAVMATGDPGQDSLYRLRMPSRVIERVIGWAERRDALVFLDIQPGLGDVADELPRLEPWLARPDVHLALDPEWNMPEGSRPGTRIGTMSAAEVNQAVDFLAEIVDRYDLPPKVLVVHRFTSGMLPDAERIRIDPRVQLVINMDGWGPPSQKIVAYRDIVAPEAEQFTGFKIFYGNDRRGGSRLMTPSEILELEPEPVYIQYQ